jgi:hypothetical protein
VLTCPGHFHSSEAIVSIALFSSLSATSLLVKSFSFGLSSFQSFAERSQNRSACSSDILPSIDFLESSLFLILSWASDMTARE